MNSTRSFYSRGFTPTSFSTVSLPMCKIEQDAEVNKDEAFSSRKNLRGFTLIELLVVIAIIGVLSSIVLASLNSARSKGADSAIKANLSSVRAMAELYYDVNTNYGASANTCSTVGSLFESTTPSNIKGAITAAVSASGGAASCRSTASPAAWAISVPMKSLNLIDSGSGTDYWCVDSTGLSKLRTDAISTPAC